MFCPTAVHGSDRKERCHALDFLATTSSDATVFHLAFADRWDLQDNGPLKPHDTGILEGLSTDWNRVKALFQAEKTRSFGFSIPRQAEVGRLFVTKSRSFAASSKEDCRA
jgi:hypothetical protein